MAFLKRVLPVVLALILAAGPVRALDIDLSTFTLDNGMQVVVIPDRRAPVVTHMVWYKVGAADEPEGKAGIAHFLEHLMFKGTPRYPDGAFSRIIRANGGNDSLLLPPTLYGPILVDRKGVSCFCQDLRDLGYVFNWGLGYG